MSVTYKDIIYELEWKRPWLYKFGVTDVEMIDKERAYVTLGNGKTYIYDSRKEGDKLRETRRFSNPEPIDEEEWRYRFSYVLEERMKEAGLNNSELSDLIGESPGYIGRLLKGIITPNAWIIYKLAIALECDVADLEYVPYHC